MNSILHVHSMYSVNDSTQTPEDIVMKAKEMGIQNITLTDHGSLLGIEPFMDAGKQYGINTIPGVEAYLKEHLIIVAKNYKGYQKISYAMRDANANMLVIKKKEFPIMSDEILERYFKNCTDVIATSACIQGPIASILLKNYKIKKKIHKDEEKVKLYKESYDKWVKNNEEYIEIQKKIKELKKEITVNSKYTKQPYQNKINKLINSLKKYDDDCDEYNKIKSEISMLEDVRKMAIETLDSLNSKVKFLEKRKVSVKNERDLVDKDKKKYLKAKDNVDSINYISSDILYNEAKERLLYLKSIFPYFYIEVQNHGLDQEEYVMPILVKLANETNTKIIAANDAHMKDNSKESIEARRIVRYNYFERAQEVSDEDKELYIKSEDELFLALKKVIGDNNAREAIKNTDILNECNVIFPEEKHYPALDNSETLFYDLLSKRKQKMIINGEWNNIYEERLNHETNVIKNMGYIDYHMIVRDFCNAGRIFGRIPREELDNIPKIDEIENWVNERNFLKGAGIGPGRGSAAGSLVCYMLGITNIDPIKYDLLFERFLNPERVSMPDIDTDVRTKIRGLIIKYLKWKFGEKSVCSIATVMKYAPKGAIQMAGRDRASQLTLKYPKKEADIFQKKYLHNVTLKLSDMINDSSSLKDAEKSIYNQIKDNKEMQIVFEHAKLIEGVLSSTSVHAGGIIISDNDNVNDYIPLAWNEKKHVWVAQCDMTKAEQKGLLKMDLLGLNNLDYICDTLYLIKKHHGIEIDMDKIPFESEVFEKIYADGNTNSVFQCESPGMKSMIKRFKPTCLNDIIILVAMYRPGPMSFIDDVIDVKHGKKPLTYKTPELEPILKDTYGAIVYQEQVMQIFQSLAGYSLGQADLVRRAMSKKKEEKLKKERPDFIYGNKERNIKGCVANGISEEIANELFDDMFDFAKYAFNKSHAASYAVVSYQTAWLKYHYPVEYLCALFNNKSQDEFEPLIEDCKTYGIELLPPNINKSFYDFVIEDGNIRYGINSIRGIGEANKNIIKKICDNRNNGSYDSIQSLLRRNIISTENGDYKYLDKSMVDAFIKSGMFDDFYENRECVANCTLTFLDNNKDNSLDENYIIKNVDHLIINDRRKSIQKNIENDIYYLGFMLSENPLKNYKEDKVYNCTPIDELKDSKNVSIYGYVTSIEDKISSKGNPYILIGLQGKSGKCNIFVMKKNYCYLKNKIEYYLNKVVKVNGSCNRGTIFANSISIMKSSVTEYYIDLKTMDNTKKVSKILNDNQEDGYIPLTINCHWLINSNGIYYESEKPKLCIINVTDEIISNLDKLLIQIKKW